MIFSSKAEYGVRLMVELGRQNPEQPTSLKAIADAEGLPLAYLEQVVARLKKSGLVMSARGAHGGYWLARPADEVTVADVVRAVEGPIANVQSMPPETIEYAGNAESLREVWVAVRANIRSVLENVTLADLVASELPESVEALTAEPDSWAAR